MLYGSSVKDVFNLPSKGPAVDAVGIEIEMELTKSIPSSPSLGEMTKQWAIKGDGSLRNHGYEFVSEPTSIKALGSLLGDWDKVLSSPLLVDRIEDCPRASVHVHVNVRDYSYNQLMNIIVAYILLEGALVAYCGKYRFGNLFALRIPEASSNFRALTSRIKEYAPFKLNSDHRYGALNLCSVSRFGTIEFRSLGSVYNPKDIDLWVSGLRYMADHAATQYKKPPDVYARYADVDRREFLEEFLGPLARPLMSRVNDIDSLFEDGEEYAIRLLSSHPDNWVYDKDFRNNEEFLKAAKDNYGYKKSQILQLTASNARAMVRENRDRQLEINPAGSDFTDWVPAVDENEEIAQNGIRSSTHTIVWEGELPINAFTSASRDMTYRTLIRENNEERARTMVFEAGFLRQEWLRANAIRRRAIPTRSRSVNFNTLAQAGASLGTTSTTTNWANVAVPAWASGMPQGGRNPSPPIEWSVVDDVPEFAPAPEEPDDGESEF